MLDCQLFGLNPGPHHLVNVAFHIANTMLLLVLLNRMTGAFWRSVMVAALFALHPLQVETVAWAAERKNVLSTFFWLLTLWAYARYAQGRGPNSEVSGQWSVVSGHSSETTDHGPRTTDQTARSTLYALRYYAWALVFFTCGLMSKPALVTLPFVLLLLDHWPLKRFELNTQHLKLSTLSPLLLEKLPFFVLAGAAAVVTVVAHRELGADWSARIPWEWRVGNALVSYVRYLGKAFWPTHLSVYYPHPGAWPAWAILGSLLVLLLVSGWVIWRARKAPYLVTGWLWFLGVLVPMIGIIQAGGQAMADRFAYVPLIGLFIMVVWGTADWLAGWRQRSASEPPDGRVAQVPSQRSERGCPQPQQFQLWEGVNLLTHCSDQDVLRLGQPRSETWATRS